MNLKGQMKSKKQNRNSEAGEVERELALASGRSALASVIAIALVFLLDTGFLPPVVAKHRESKIDEVIVASITLLIGVNFFFLRRWLRAWSGTAWT